MNRLANYLALAVVVASGMLLAPVASANTGVALIPFSGDSGNLPSLQRGARNFMAYCSGCHSLKYLRYNRMAEDLKIPEDVLKKNLMFSTDNAGEVMKVAMPAASGEWFGRVPPDLSLEARARGTSWIYTYLKSFYLDPSRPLGVNNTVLVGANMPHVLWELQGWQAKVEHKTEASGTAAEAKEDHHGGSAFEQVVAGSLKPAEYDAFVGDLVNFLDYAAEPGKAARISLGFKVLMYLFLLLVLTYFLKKEFWRDIH